MCIWLLNKKEVIQKSNYFIGQKVVFYGKLSNDDNFPISTHKIDNWTEAFWLKESSINLNNFVDDDIIVEWSILEFSKKYPVLSISTIKIPAYKLSITDNRYFFTQDLISFDFSKDIDVYSKKEWWNIVIYYQWAPLLYVKTFICSNVTESQNCAKIKEKHVFDMTETFISALWYTYYRNKENSWIAFNDNNVWYIFTANSDNDLLNISHLINIVDSKFLSTYKEDFILSWCSNDETQLTKISEINKKIIDDDLIKLQVSGEDQNGESITCKLNVNVFNNRDINNVSINQAS